MANLVCNQAKGKVNELHDRVVNNDPANSAIIIVALVVTGDQDDAIRDADTLAAVLALANVAEATNTNYARKVLTDAVLSGSAVDDTGNTRSADIPDQTFSAIAAGDNWTDLLVCYDSDTTGGTDANIIPMTLQDFAVTPDGNDIVATVNASGYFQAS